MNEETVELTEEELEVLLEALKRQFTAKKSTRLAVMSVTRKLLGVPEEALLENHSA